MIHLILILYTFLLHVCEAGIEAKIGDKRHWHSLLISILLFLIPFFLFSIEWRLILIYPAIRVWFDLMYNFAKGNHWAYLGSSAKTDRMIKKLNLDGNEILLIRFLLSLTLLIISI